MFLSFRMIPLILLIMLPASMAGSETSVDPMVLYSDDFDGREHYLRITSSSTRVTTPESVFRVSTRLMLEYDCHESAPLGSGRPLRVTASHIRLPVETRAAISVESFGHFLADLFGREPGPFVSAVGTVRRTNLGTGAFVESGAAVVRDGYDFARDTKYKMTFDDPSLAAPEQLLSAFAEGHAVRIDVRTPEFDLEAVFSLPPEQAAPLATLANRCPRTD